jgi:pSer/pThr/pTyr-binding forkhead associated (FHA) protein
VGLQLVHTFGRHVGIERKLDLDVVRFGRAGDNDVVFDADEDRRASAYHAEIRREGAFWLLVDLDSMNGTWVQGRRVQRHAIASGDEITFGSSGPRVRVVLDENDPAALPPGPVTRVPVGGSAPPPTEPAPFPSAYLATSLRRRPRRPPARRPARRRSTR